MGAKERRFLPGTSNKVRRRLVPLAYYFAINSDSSQRESFESITGTLVFR